MLQTAKSMQFAVVRARSGRAFLVLLGVLRKPKYLDKGKSADHILLMPVEHPQTPRGESVWTEFTPWFMTVISVVVLGCLAWFLLENIYWFKAHAIESTAPTDEAYRVYVYQLHLSMIKRSVGLFAGFALIFVGTSVAFYTLKHEINLTGQAAGGSAKLTTASPGIIAMFLGVALIMFCIYSKDHFPDAPSQQPATVHPVDIHPQ
jgi:hypothetical protein